ncbi:hypothetical protein [Pseudomonas fontis]|uniref:TolB amino-terminal domain-containing protein n=1 Tax=Pseudomonas fontis TaxID=2942633 RepID=A0ABT5P1C1_9PSED|nr:hypothetical protein [Pseudomonas fontis]MDD0975491.1 hypothetical protein [Pseudomonas fontis]MDD0994210.1 hypothetical protein [Pseudomonas fontis]
MTDTGMEFIGADLVAVDEVESARKALLASEAFKKSPRMARLLDYLVGKALLGSYRETSEYAIGIGVFDRDPLLYSPGEDPVVRVQVGRLRTKLKNYYASAGRNATVEFVVPLGGYMPIFRHKRHRVNREQKASAFAVCLFKCVAPYAEWECFTQGLHEELTHHLYKNLGRKIVVDSSADTCRGNKDVDSVPACSGVSVGYRLEGSVHVDAERIRTSVRLIDVTTGCVTWSEQFNRAACTAIAHQQELASSICQALQRFLSVSNDSVQEHLVTT